MDVIVNIPLLRARAAGAVPRDWGGVGAWVQQTAQTGILGSQKCSDSVGQHSAEQSCSTLAARNTTAACNTGTGPASAKLNYEYL